MCVCGPAIGPRVALFLSNLDKIGWCLFYFRLDQYKKRQQRLIMSGIE